MAARLLYSASQEDLETVFCLFVFHETKEEPKKMQYLVKDLLVSIQLAQSESLYAVMVNGKDPLLKNKFFDGQPFRYFKTCKVAFQCISLGVCRNYDNCWTA